MSKTIDLSPLTAALDAREWSIIQDYAVRRQLGDLRQCAEALGVGL